MPGCVVPASRIPEVENADCRSFCETRLKAPVAQISSAYETAQPRASEMNAASNATSVLMFLKLETAPSEREAFPWQVLARGCCMGSRTFCCRAVWESPRCICHVPQNAGEKYGNKGHSCFVCLGLGFGDQPLLDSTRHPGEPRSGG